MATTDYCNMALRDKNLEHRNQEAEEYTEPKSVLPRSLFRDNKKEHDDGRYASLHQSRIEMSKYATLNNEESSASPPPPGKMAGRRISPLGSHTIVGCILFLLILVAGTALALATGAFLILRKDLDQLKQNVVVIKDNVSTLHDDLNDLRCRLRYRRTSCHVNQAVCATPINCSCSNMTKIG